MTQIKGTVGFKYSNQVSCSFVSDNNLIASLPVLVYTFRSGKPTSNKCPNFLALIKPVFVWLNLARKRIFNIRLIAFSFEGL